MPLALLKYALHKKHRGERYFPSEAPLRRSYDVVIIGGGGHGLACAYYLAKNWGIRNVAVLEKGWLASGNTARNTTIIRSNYLTPEGTLFYEESMRLYRSLAKELNINLMYSERGHLTLAHTDAAIRTSRWRAEVNKHVGIDSELVFRDDLRKICPELNLSEDVRFPVLGALYHPPGAIARHDAVAWGYARGAMQSGVEIHQQTEVTGISSGGGESIEVQTNRGSISAGKGRAGSCRYEFAGCRHARNSPAHSHDSIAGLRVRTRQTGRRSNHRFRFAARLHLAIRPR